MLINLVTCDPFKTSLVAQMVKRLSTMQETWVRSLGREDCLEKKMATHSSTLAQKIPLTEDSLPPEPPRKPYVWCLLIWSPVTLSKISSSQGLGCFKGNSGLSFSRWCQGKSNVWWGWVIFRVSLCRASVNWPQLPLENLLVS